MVDRVSLMGRILAKARSSVFRAWSGPFAIRPSTVGGMENQDTPPSSIIITQDSCLAQPPQSSSCARKLQDGRNAMRGSWASSGASAG